MGALPTRQKRLFFHRPVASRKCNGTFLQVTWSQLNADGDTAFNPFPILDPTTEIAPIHLDENWFSGVALLLKFRRHLVSGFPNGSAMFRLWYDGEYNGMARRDSRRKNGAIVVGVHHDDLAHQTSARTPTGGPTELLGAVPSKKTDVGSFGKVLAKEMGGARLHGLAALHHCFDAKRGTCTMITYALGLFASVRRT